MKEKITGIISFSGGIIWIGMIIYRLYTIKPDVAGIIAVVYSFIVAISIILYTVWTGFGRNQLKKIKHQNDLLKAKIEQKELQDKLNK